MPLNSRFLRAACVCLGVGWSLPCLAQAAVSSGQAQAQPGDANAPGPGSGHARMPASVLTVRALVAPACLVTMASADFPSVRCTREVDWQAGIGVDAGASVGWSTNDTPALPAEDCGAGASSIPCLIVEF